MSALQQKLTALVEPLLASLKLELWGLEFIPSRRSILRIYIEKQGAQPVLSESNPLLQNAPTDATVQALAGEAESVAQVAQEQDASEQLADAEEADFPEEFTDGTALTGAGIDECRDASRLIGLTLEVEDIIDGSYVLEVSSPGLERVFFTPAQLAKYAGEIVDLSLHSAQESHPGRKRFTGRVEVLADDPYKFRLDPLNAADLSPEGAEPLEFFWDNVKKVRLVYVVPEKPNAPKPGQGRQKKKSAKAAGKKISE